MSYNTLMEKETIPPWSQNIIFALILVMVTMAGAGYVYIMSKQSKDGDSWAIMID
jgi:hypothetical protein